MSRIHGGPDAQGSAQWDFSTNANACGPCPLALEAVQAADPLHYPDPAYGVLRQTLAQFHGVSPGRIWLAASGSEAIARLTAWVAHNGATSVGVPEHAYGDYASLAHAWGMKVLPGTGAPVNLQWCCEPSSPLGQACPLPDFSKVVALDRAYEPLRLDGDSTWPMEALDSVHQLWTPNKALGLTGVRGAYVIAPKGAEAVAQTLEVLGPSWPLGAHAVAMLNSWVQPGVQRWVAASRDVLRRWRGQQMGALTQAGWTVLPTLSNYFCARPLQPFNTEALRERGFKLRDATSFGLPGFWRLSVQPPVAQQALLQALADVGSSQSVRSVA